MNELQLVLLIFAVIVIAVLYFFSKKRQQSPQKAEPSNSQEAVNPSIDLAQAKTGIDDTPTKEAILDAENLPLEPSFSNNGVENETPENQTSFAFGDAFEQPKPESISETIEPEVSTVSEPTAKKGGNHHVLEVEELYSVGEVGSTVGDLPKPNFGIPDDNAPAASQTPSASQGQHQVFVLMVLSTGGSGQEFSMEAVNQALLGVGLSFSDRGIYVTRDSQGSDIIRVANIMEPGSFPAENLHTFTTPGIALILELPTSVRAPAAMHDLIMMGRKVSQRLNGRLYNMERHLIKESDLQAMRDAAVEYESEPL
ncbi:MAG: cell division protein ZipA C-terminal FtsZ-binding domain-containing protein [Pseudomonadota bacterium]|nr:cell division protein ZipA C-terminal FtsZ-binding domain-containing protein [Pseudomonadota bacterium]